MPAQRGRGGGCRCNAMARLAKAVCAARGAVFLNSCRFLLDVILQGNPGALHSLPSSNPVTEASRSEGRPSCLTCVGSDWFILCSQSSRGQVCFRDSDCSPSSCPLGVGLSWPRWLWWSPSCWGWGSVRLPEPTWTKVVGKTNHPPRPPRPTMPGCCTRAGAAHTLAHRSPPVVSCSGAPLLSGLLRGEGPSVNTHLARLPPLGGFQVFCRREACIPEGTGRVPQSLKLSLDRASSCSLVSSVPSARVALTCCLRGFPCSWKLTSVTQGLSWPHPGSVPGSASCGGVASATGCGATLLAPG